MYAVLYNPSDDVAPYGRHGLWALWELLRGESPNQAGEDGVFWLQRSSRFHRQPVHFLSFFLFFSSPASSEMRQGVRKYTLRGLKKSGPKEEDTQSAKRDNTMVSGLEPSAMNDMMQATTVS